LKFNATDATIQLNFNIQQKANPSVKVVGEFIVARGVAYYALEEGTNNPRTFKELLELANDDNGEAIMSETS
jgi:hypothetical protein